MDLNVVELRKRLVKEVISFMREHPLGVDKLGEQAEREMACSLVLLGLASGVSLLAFKGVEENDEVMNRLADTMHRALDDMLVQMRDRLKEQITEKEIDKLLQQILKEGENR